MADQSTDVLRIFNDAKRGFDSVLRGYDRAQVDDEIHRLDEDVRHSAAERDAALARSADLAAQLASAQAQLESTRRQLRAAAEDVTPTNVDERVKAIVQSANTEAARIRAEAEALAEQTHNGAADAAARIRAASQAEAQRLVGVATERLAEADDTFRRRIAEAEQHRQTIEAELARSISATRSAEDALTAEAAANRLQLDADASAAREAADAAALAARTRTDEDFEITLRLRRTEVYDDLAGEKAEAEAHWAQIVADAEHEVQRLHGERDAAHAHISALNEKLARVLADSVAQTPEGDQT